MRSLKRIIFVLLLCLVAHLLITKFKQIQLSSQPTRPPLKSYLTDRRFREELIDERLKSHSRVYDRKTIGCVTDRTLTAAEEFNFDEISQSLVRFAGEMISYPQNRFHGRGIVLTVGPVQMRYLRVNLKMMELTRTGLLVQVWFSSLQVSWEEMKELIDLVRKLDLSLCSFEEHQCENRNGVIKLDSTLVYVPTFGVLDKAFPYKPAAILSSTFVEVLFLDCDAYLTRDPEDLFLSDPMYHRFGSLFFPDSYRSRQHPLLWKLLNTTCAEEEYEFDSSVMLVNKKRVWNALYLTKLLNDHHSIFYQFASQGDKDTFRLAFRWTKTKYYLVMTPCATGRFDGYYFCGFTLCKTDSLAQKIYINHVHMFKYDSIEYSADTLGHTRIALGDPNDHSFLLQQCRLAEASTSCFHVLGLPNEWMNDQNCFVGRIPAGEVESHQYHFNESLLNQRSRKNQLLITKTNSVMPQFVDYLLQQLASNHLNEQWNAKYHSSLPLSHGIALLGSFLIE